MRKSLVVLAVVMVLVMVSGVIAVPQEIRDETFEKFIENVASEKGVSVDEDTEINKVDFEDLPENVALDNIDETNLGLYEIDSGDGRPVFVLTLSEETFEKVQESEDYRRSFLSFGFDGEMSGSAFLKTSNQVGTSLEKGYVMVREGSITGLSTNLEVLGIGDGYLETVVYVNGKVANFGNSLSTRSNGVKKDYASQSEGIINFKAGDVVSVELKESGDALWKDVITLVEVTTVD